MSTFNGFVRDYPQISIDYFSNNSLKSSIYFLSHCHSDHMKGLDSPEFYNKLKENPAVKLYMSTVSKHLILNDEKYKHLKSKVETLPLENPTTIHVPDIHLKNDNVVVTFFPAGHCPGSIMILIEGGNGNVLYTGDFRLSVEDIMHFKSLHSLPGKIKLISSLYIDTTFCTPEAFYIPSRQQSLEALIMVIEPWLAKCDHIVRLNCSAQYGYEYLYIGLAKKFKMKIHVNKSKFEKYQEISEILDAVTCNPNETRLHSCQYYDNKVFSNKENAVCRYHLYNNLKNKVLNIKLSAMWFTQHISVSDAVFKLDENFYRICYSLHSSLSEIQAIVRYLNPKCIFPTVVPCGYTENEILRLLTSIQHCSGNGNAAVVNFQTDPATLGMLKTSKYADGVQGHGVGEDKQGNSTEESLNFSNSQSPVKECESSEKDLFSSYDSDATYYSPPKKLKVTNNDNNPQEMTNSPKWKYEISSSDSEPFNLCNTKDL